ncbi:MAG TPA: FAD-dependent oxidoreductase [Polyangia bacterium]|nr:FAD-dependent oxidoreductase [Polyangia bacterium]
MSETVDLFVPLSDADEPLAKLVERALGWRSGGAGELRVLRRSLDARKGRPLGHRLRVSVSRPGEPVGPAAPPRAVRHWPAGRPIPRVVVIGAGPAGTWAALRLAEGGVPVTILEQGKPVQPRRHDLALITRGTLTASSNYCFGEGGAGTYSDGKLYTRAKDHAGIAEVIGDLMRFGAPPEIEIESRPHVGSNRLPKVLTALRAHLAALGVEHRFETAARGLVIERGRVRAVRVDGGEVPADVVILAVGHSARAVYAWAAAGGIALARKPIAVGVRIEHPQPLIDRIQYGPAAGHPKLPPAFYELTASAGERGVYSFCMCPGGWIVPAATEPDGVVVNGMSLSRRDSPFANAGLVVSVSAGDFGPDAAGPLAGIAFQRAIEQAAFRAGGGRFRAPAQRLGDFLAGRAGGALGASSYRPGLQPADLAAVLPPFVVEAMRAGLRQIGARIPSFLLSEALLIAAETRTSAPVRLLRDPITLVSPSAEGLYPCGEGAGYAGGIVSAALDGARVAERILARA